MDERRWCPPWLPGHHYREVSKIRLCRTAQSASSGRNLLPEPLTSVLRVSDPGRTNTDPTGERLPESRSVALMGRLPPREWWAEQGRSGTGQWLRGRPERRHKTGIDMPLFDFANSLPLLNAILSAQLWQLRVQSLFDRFATCPFARHRPITSFRIASSSPSSVSRDAAVLRSVCRVAPSTAGPKGSPARATALRKPPRMDFTGRRRYKC
jgi:hypothetical protein